MAKFILGAGITALIGSSGGTTFKRNKSTNVWMNKSRGASRSRNLQNIRLNNNNLIFQSWAQLPSITQDAWNATASAVKVKDKFGQDVNISGVAFQRKCQLSLALVNNNAIDPTEFSTTLSGITLTDATFNFTTNNFFVEFTTGGIVSNIAIMVEILQRPLPAPQFIRRGVVKVNILDGSSSFNIYDELIAKYPYLNANYNFRVYAYEINNYGWTGVQSYIDVTKVT
jgi:hypothetical protein